ncbi:MAG: SMP-30/gluconolactonase/LRE family protein, partial [Cyanobacteria bacterium P01_A01_bin.17]
MSRIHLPVQRPTACTFGGSNRSQLYITTASVGLSESEIQKSFYSGDVFCVETEISGLPSYRFCDSGSVT